MNRSILLLGLAAAASAITFAGERRAAACGGCFHPPSQTVSDISDERMLLSVSPTQTTLYDQIRYTGSPTSFAWVLPIHGTVDVGLSADVLFDSIDAMTTTTINPPIPNCPGIPSDCGGLFGSANASAPTAAGGNDGVTVTKQENVGPYATVQLHATDSSALNNWLVQNGFNLAADVLPVIDEYVKEGFDFLAMKLIPSAGIQAMRPVRVTSPGASLSLPLRMAAIGTGATVGITIWTVSDGRYEPQNFPFFHIEDSQLVWDFSTSSSNYTTLRASNESKLAGKGWEIESSISLDQQAITNVILSGGQFYGGGGGGGFGGPISTSGPADAGEDYLPVSGDDGGADGGAGETAEEVRTADIAALFAGMSGSSVRITRMRSDISHAAMTSDFILQASADQSELSNIRTVTQGINDQCPIYNNCNVIGTGSPAEATPVSGTSSIGGLKSAGSCIAAPRSNDGSKAPWAIGLGMIGLAVTRIVRSRRRSKPSAKR